MDFLNTTLREKLKSLFYKDFARWRTVFEILITLYDPKLWIFITNPYEKPRIAGSVSFKRVNQMSTIERANFDLNQKTFETILECLPRDEASCYNNQETSFNLWNSLGISYGSNTKLSMTSSDEGIKEELMKKEDEINALESHILTLENECERMKLKIVELEKREEELQLIQSQVLNMEKEREELCVKVTRMEEGILEFESQQKVFTRLQEDHELALKTIQDLRERLSESEKDVKKVYERKSSCEKKKFSQFTNYSLQKNKKCMKCSGKIQSTKTSNHQKVDFRDNSGNIKCNKSSVSTSPKKTRDFKPTLHPESRRTKSYAYTREQMFALAPPRFNHMVQNRRNDFVPFSWRTSVQRKEFRNETRCLNFRWNSMSLDFIDESYRKVSKISRKIGTVLKWVPKVVV